MSSILKVSADLVHSESAMFTGWRAAFRSLVAFFVVAIAALAAVGQVIVTPSAPVGWTVATTTGGTTTFVADGTAPSGAGALSLTTINDNNSRARYVRGVAGLPIASLNQMSYWSKTNAGVAEAGPAYRIGVYLDGTAAQFTTFTFEPYWANGLGDPAPLGPPGNWQFWDVAANTTGFWSSATRTAGGTCNTTAGAGGPPFYTLAWIKANCPNAVVVSHEVGIGSFNPNWNVYVDELIFNGTEFDFEASFTTPTTTQVISYADPTNWLYYNDGASASPGPASPEGIDPTCGSFVPGPGTTPLGIGSSQISVSGQRRCNLASYQFSGTPLAALDTLKYSTYNPSAGNAGSPNRSGYLQFNADFNGSDTWQRRLLFLPTDNGSVLQNTWQEWDTINGGAAMWRYSGATWPVGVGEPGTTPGTTPKSWNTILNTYPGARMRVTDSFFGVRVGEPYTDGYTENIDNVQVGTTSSLRIYDFDPLTTVTVTPASVPTAFDNDYTRINNAVQAAPNGATIVLAGTFNWTEPFAAASWARGSDGLMGTAATDNDNYAVLAPANRNGVTVTAASLGAATIQGPGDLAGANLEGVFQFYAGGTNQNWTISNLQLFDFDNAIGFYHAGGPTTAYNDTKILNNRIRIAADLNATVAPADVNQNIGIHFAFGTNQQISGNQIDFAGNGISDGTTSYSTEVGMQSNTSGGSAYDGLQITNNILRVLNAQDNANPERIRGIWENGHANSSNITVSGNSFTNLAPGNDPAVNRQQAFWVTSHSSSTTTVSYTGNSVSGANIGFKWLGDPEFPGQNYTGNQPVRMTSNTIVGNATGVLVQNNGLVTMRHNRIVGNSVVGVNNIAGTVDAEYNWWGCNYGPGTGGAGCAGTPNGTLGTVDADPWLILTTSASPTVIGLGDSSLISSFLNTQSSGPAPPAGAIPNGIPVGFAGILGTVNPAGSVTSSGNAGTTFFTAAAFGSGGATTTVDGQTVTAAVTITASCVDASVSTTITSLTGVTVNVPVDTTDTSGRGIISTDFVLTYNTAVVTTPVVSLGTVTAGRTLTVNTSTPGVVVISIFGSLPFTGSGTLANVQFNVVGLPGTSSPISFSSFRYNEGSPCSTTSNGLVTVLSGSISGTVTYGNVGPVGPAPPRFIPDVTLNAVGSVNVSATTPAAPTSNGQYTLSGMGAGAYTVTPSKVGGVVPLTGQTITSFDSGLIAQHVVGFTTPPYLPLSASAQAAADVSGTGGITSFDAALIARWVAGLPNFGNTATWVFTPASRNYANVNANQTAQDYTAILMGDVSGNYDQSLSPARPAPVDDETALVATAPQINARAGEAVVVPIGVGDTTGRGISAYQFELLYDPEVLEPAAEAFDVAGSLSDGYSVVVNAKESGRMIVVVYGVRQLAGQGSLLSLRFNAIGPVGSTSRLEWRNLLFNEGEIPFRSEDGLVSVAAADEKVIRGRVLSPDGGGVSRTRITIVDTSGNVRTSTTSSFGHFEFAGLTLGQTYTVRVDSKRYRFAPQTISLTSNVAEVQLIAQE